MFDCLPPYLTTHLFFHKFQQINVGIAWRTSLWASFLCTRIHHLIIRFRRGVVEWLTPRELEKKDQTFVAKWPLTIMCSIVSGPGLWQQKQLVGSIPKVVNLASVGRAFPVMPSPPQKKRALKRNVFMPCIYIGHRLVSLRSDEIPSRRACEITISGKLPHRFVCNIFLKMELCIHDLMNYHWRQQLIKAFQHPILLESKAGRPSCCWIS